jgi:hypothetical protein
MGIMEIKDLMQGNYTGEVTCLNQQGISPDLQKDF